MTEWIVGEICRPLQVMWMVENGLEPVERRRNDELRRRKTNAATHWGLNNCSLGCCGDCLA